MIGLSMTVFIFLLCTALYHQQYLHCCAAIKYINLYVDMKMVDWIYKYLFKGK